MKTFREMELEESMSKLDTNTNKINTLLDQQLASLICAVVEGEDEDQMREQYNTNLNKFKNIKN